MLLAVAHNNIHPEVAQWMTKATANGGAYSSQTVNSLNILMSDLKRYGLRSKISRLNMFVGENQNAGLTPLIADKGASMDTTAGTMFYTPSGGFSHNSTISFIKTGFFPAVDLADYTSAHQGCWNFSPYSNTVTSTQGCGDPAVNRFSFHYPWSDGNIYSDIYGTANGTSRSRSLNPLTVGSVLQNLICSLSGGVNRIYVNGQPIALSVTGTGAGTVPNTEYLVVSGSTSVPNNYRVGYYTIGSGLTTSENFLYNKAITEFMNRLGRS